MPTKATAPLPDPESEPTAAIDPITTTDDPAIADTEPVVVAPVAAAAGSAPIPIPAQPNQPPVSAHPYDPDQNAMPGQPIMMYAPYVPPPPAPSPIRDPREFARRVLPFSAWFCLIVSIVAGIFWLIIGISSASSSYDGGIYALLGLGGLIVSLAIGLFAFAHLLGMKHTMEMQMYRPVPIPVT
ncbi:MAG: hypothetical protein FWD63_02755 [Propionibacteriaceae bacterium]|nr:hypothetical protein [Propionibacteriaceae bacterium]